MFCHSICHRLAVNLFVLAVVGIFDGESVQAQQDPPPEKRPFAHQGTLTGIRAPFLEVKVGEAKWVYKVEAEADKIKYTAEAESAWLRPGLFVRYDGADNKGKTREPVRKLFVFSPRPQFAMGIQDDGDGTFLVAGRLKNLKNGRMTIVAGRRKAVVELDKEAEIQVDYLNLDLIQLGDNVVASGDYFVEGQGIATLLEVTAKEKLKPREKKKRRQREKKPAKGASTE